VETYSALWGRRTATTVWLTAMSITALLALEAARGIDFLKPVALLIGALLAMALVSARQFFRAPVKGRGKLIENMAGVWSLLLYTGIGLVPMAYRALGGR